MAKNSSTRPKIIQILAKYGLEASHDEWVADLVDDLMKVADHDR